MKVRISFTLDIDPEMWALSYGTGPKEIRQDVKNYAYHIVQQQFDSTGLLLK